MNVCVIYRINTSRIFYIFRRLIVTTLLIFKETLCVLYWIIRCAYDVYIREKKKVYIVYIVEANFPNGCQLKMKRIIWNYEKRTSLNLHNKTTNMVIYGYKF